MTKKSQQQIMVGLDIGTSKVVVIVGEIRGDDQLDIIGLGHQRSSGIKKGVVVNIKSTIDSIKKAIEEAELMAGCQINSVVAGIAGSHIKSFNSHGIIAVRDQEVQKKDIQRVIDAAKTMAFPTDHKILHILPQEYIVDKQDCIREPLGMSGVRLEAKVHIITGAVSAAQNIIKSVRQCSLDVDEIILEQLASSEAVLTDDEKELGVCLVDIGGGTSDIAVFSEGTIRHTAVIPIAGDQVTNDLAVALRTPTQYAEQLKINHSCALVRNATKEPNIKLHTVGDRPAKHISQRILAEVIEPRYEELFSLILAELRKSGQLNLCSSGIVLTGGSSKVPGLLELAEEIFQMPVRLGVPHSFHGISEQMKNPIYATGIGLLHYANKKRQQGQSTPLVEVRLNKVWDNMKSWFRMNF